MKSNFLFFLFVYMIISCDNANTSEKNNTQTIDSIRGNQKNLTELFANNRFSKIEKFSFLNKNGFTYKGKGGTVLIFPPNIFDCKNQDSIEMNICEYSDLISIVQANLSTTSDGKMLETNGMVYCKAYTNKKELQLKKGKSFTCMFNKPKVKDFKLFEGEEKDGVINWINPISETQTLTNKPKIINISKAAEESKKEALYICTYGSDSDVGDIESSLVFSDNPSLNIVTYFFDKYNISYNDLLPFAPNESIVLNFNLTKSGRLVFKNSDNPINPKIRSKLIGYFENMPEFAGYTNNETGQKEDLPVYISICPNQSLNDKLENDKDNMSKINQMIAEKESKEQESRMEEEKKEKERMAKNKIAIEAYEKNQELFEKAEKIIFKVTKMGWINCDKFYNDKREKTDLNFLNLEEYFSYNLQIVFPAISSVYDASNVAKASNIPINEPIKIIFVGMKNNETYFFNKSMTTSEKNEIQIKGTKIEASTLNNSIENSLN